MTVVLDSSATLAWCFADERSPAAMAVLDLVVDGHAYVPAPWRYEYANGLFVAERRGRLRTQTRLALLNEFGGLDIRKDAPPRAGHWATLSELASQHGLTIYDASYLELAMRRVLPLATFDGALARAARSSGLRVHG